MNKKNKGFTLIEMMIVIAIIAILSGLVLGGLSSARAKARDSRRISALKTFQALVEANYNSGNNTYPAGDAAGTPTLISGYVEDKIASIKYYSTTPFDTYCITVDQEKRTAGAADGCTPCGTCVCTTGLIYCLSGS
ncbi:MAG: prepilin-type N-terminal cleavage/methylation domain-containing protein [Candidatus Parcubacteria bacterium]|nr:prepilin-type N-terminal cleavage/methylation domain-containing protein [Candidatus Parcubacteria bacterium]